MQAPKRNPNAAVISPIFARLIRPKATKRDMHVHLPDSTCDALKNAADFLGAESVSEAARIVLNRFAEVGPDMLYSGRLEALLVEAKVIPASSSARRRMVLEALGQEMVNSVVTRPDGTPERSDKGHLQCRTTARRFELLEEFLAMAKPE